MRGEEVDHAAKRSDEDGDGPGRVLNKNLNGIQGDNKLWKFLSTLSREHETDPLLACLVQEHNLKSCDKNDHYRIAHFKRFMAIISYAPSAAERGGTAIFIPFSTVKGSCPWLCSITLTSPV